MADLRLRGVRKSFGDVHVIPHIDLDVRDGEFVVFVGPSGCGKSTLLRIICGLERASDGDISIDGRRVNDIAAAQRGLAMVFQSYALYPHMTVRQNMGFALRLAGTPRAERDRKVEEAARILQLEPYLERRPKDLSGGQRQRVAIGRAIVRQPKVFLFDEPLSNLDAALRGQTRVELLRLHEELKATMIYVTHDQVEAMTMADKIVVLRAGRIEQVGSPLALYNTPANRFVAGFIGSPRMNFLPARLRDATTADVEGLGRIAIGARPGLASGDTVTLGIRPEHLAEGAGPAATVQSVEQLGGLSYIRLTPHDMVLQLTGQTALAAGDPVHLQFPSSRLHVFTEDGQAVAAPESNA